MSNTTKLEIHSWPGSKRGERIYEILGVEPFVVQGITCHSQGPYTDIDQAKEDANGYLRFRNLKERKRFSHTRHQSQWVDPLECGEEPEREDNTARKPVPEQTHQPAQVGGNTNDEWRDDLLDDFQW